MKSILEVIEEYDIDLKKEGNILRAYCPFHEDTGRANFTVYPETNSWYCFAGCGGGDVIQLVSKMENITRAQAKAQLQDENVELDDLSCKIADLGTVSTNTISYNQELNSLASRWFSQFIRKYPEKNIELFVYMREFDKQIDQPIDHVQMQKILEDLRNKLQVNSL